MMAQPRTEGRPIEVVEYTPEWAPAWQEFLAKSNNGTLFHDLDFLAYHAPGKFRTHHLIFRQNDHISALLPGAIVKEPDGSECLKSPYGASIGGFALPIGQPIETACEIVQALQEHVARSGLQGAEFRLAPSFYMAAPDESLGFALMANGFRLVMRWLCPTVPLPATPDEVMQLIHRRRARYIRAGLREGIVVRETGPASLDQFYDLLLADRRRHDATPTHSRQDIEYLLTRLPGRVRLYMCGKDGLEMAGLLLFILNPRVAYTFYLCQDPSHRDLQLAAILNAHVARHMVTEGVRYLDFGPTTFDDFSLNRGLDRFKAEFGARGFCRDTWRWQVA